jgi:hypothetical protein
MKAGSRPQYYRIRRMVQTCLPRRPRRRQVVREGAVTGNLTNSTDFMIEPKAVGAMIRAVRACRE